MDELLKVAKIDDNKKALFTDFSKMLEYFLNCDYSYLNRKSETVIPSNESFLYISQYLKENYGDKYEMFDNLSLTDLKVKWVSNQTKKEILDFLFERFCFYLDHYHNIKDALNSVYTDIENSNCDYETFFSMYYVLSGTIWDLKECHRFMTKRKVKKLVAKELFLYEIVGDDMYDVENNTITMANTNDVIETCIFLHEFIHYYNVVEVNDSFKQTLSNNVYEFPSIAFELDYAKWLKEKDIINHNDMFCVLFKRIQSSTVELSKFFDDDLDNIDDDFDPNFLNSNTVTKSINYIMSSVLALYTLNQIDKDDSFREKLNYINDNLYKLSYEDILETIGLDRNNPNFINLLMSNFEEFIKNNTFVNERNEKTR